MEAEEKRVAGEKAAEFVRDGMIVGLGTGSTAAYTVRRLGEMVRQGLAIKGVPTSNATANLARSLGIPLVSVDEVDSIDVTIDGADEVDRSFNGIKGGGGALLFEKIVAAASKWVIWVVDSRKMVEQLGGFPLPVEVVPFGFTHVQRRLAEQGMAPVLRVHDNKPFITDSGNYILDLHLNVIEDPKHLGNRLKMVTGVVEHGLFLDVVDTVVAGRDGSVEVISRPKART